MVRDGWRESKSVEEVQGVIEGHGVWKRSGRILEGQGGGGEGHGGVERAREG